MMDKILSRECIEAWDSFFAAHLEFLTPMQRQTLSTQTFLQRLDFLERCVDQLTKHSREITAKNKRMYCLTPHSDSTLMWAHYAGCHRGICLEFSTAHPRIGGAMEVLYADRRPVIDWRVLNNSFELTKRMLLMKSQDWAYESEYRIVVQTDDCPGDFLALPLESLRRVIVGIRGDLEAVKAIVNECAPDVAVDIARQSSDEYRVIIPPTYV
jgi:hypothetical protein